MNSQTKQPLVSIITVVYNSVMTLEQTITSVIEQKYKNIEYILIDGGSNDGSVEIIEKYSSQIKYWISEKDNGIYDAMNKGLREAAGSIIAFINSDDYYEKNAVAIIVDTFNSNDKAQIVHGLLQYISYEGNPIMIRGHYFSFLNRGMIEHPTCFIKKELYDIVGDFNIKYVAAADYEWMLRARENGANFLLIQNVLTNFRFGGISDTLVSAQEELLIKREFRLISSLSYIYGRVYIFLKKIMSVKIIIF